jgi:DNA-binding NarL/FixJ family response regulator
MKHESIHYAIADDDDLFVRTLYSVLSQNLQFKMSFCAADGQQLLELFEQHQPRLLFVDLFMPVISGVEAIQLLRSKYPETKIIAYSSVFQQEYDQLLRSVQVNVYCERNVEIICRWLENMDTNHDYINTIYLQEWRERDKMRQKCIASPQQDVSLSNRELQVIALVCQGKTNQEIAEELCLSKRSVDTYIPRILAKINLRNTRELAIYGFKKGYCKLDCLSENRHDCHRNSIFDSLIESRKKKE